MTTRMVGVRNDTNKGSFLWNSRPYSFNNNNRILLRNFHNSSDGRSKQQQQPCYATASCCCWGRNNNNSNNNAGLRVLPTNQSSSSVSSSPFSSFVGLSSASSSSSASSTRAMAAPTSRSFSSKLAAFNGQDGKWMVDTLIIGGGPIGSSTAYHLGKMMMIPEGGQPQSQCQHNIVVLEQDPTYQSASALVSAGGIRQQFSLKENVQMSMYGRDFLRQAGEMLTPTAIIEKSMEDHNGEKDGIVDVQFQEHGYLFLTTNNTGKKTMIENYQAQVEAGCTTTKLMTPTELSIKFPWLNTSDIQLGSYGFEGEGWFDPWLYIQALKQKNQEDFGVRYIHGRPIKASRDEVSGCVTSVDIQLLGDDAVNQSSPIVTLQVNNIVNAAGSYAAPLMDVLAGSDKQLEYPVPVRPRKRCIFYFHCSKPEDGDVIIPDIAPLTVDSSNVYFRSEGKPGANTFICGVSPTHEDDEDFDFSSVRPEVTENDYQHLFVDRIWPSIYNRVPAFGNIKVLSQWAGLYEYNVVDQNAIIDYHPEIPNVVLVNGFSGHGLQQSPAAGRAVAELLANDGKYLSLDLAIFKFDRCMMITDEDGAKRSMRPPVLERGIV